MSMTDETVEQDLDELFDKIWPWLVQVPRAVFYFVVSFLLLTANNYGLSDNRWLISLTLGIMGFGHRISTAGLAGISALVALAILSPEVVHGIKSALG